MGQYIIPPPEKQGDDVVTSAPNGTTPFSDDMKLYERLLYNYDLCEAQAREDRMQQDEEVHFCYS